MNRENDKFVDILLWLVSFLVPIGHFIFEDSQVGIFYLKRGLCCVLMFYIFIILRPIKKAHLPGDYHKIVILYFLFMISIVPAALETNAGLGVPFNFIIPFAFAIILILRCNSQYFLKMIKAFWWAVLSSSGVVVFYILGFVPRPSGNVIGYEVSSYGHTYIDQFYMIGLHPSIESASVYRAVAIMMGVLLYTLYRKKFYLMGSLAIGIHQLLSLFYTGNGRAGSLFLIISICYYYLFNKQKKWKTVSIFVVVLCVILGSSDYFKFSKLNRAHLPVGTSISKRAILYTSGRGYKCFLAFDMIKKNPLFGVGLYNFVRKAPFYNVPSWVMPLGDTAGIDCASSLVFLDVAAEAGILSALILLLFVVSFFLYVYRLQKKSQNTVAMKQYRILCAILIGSFFCSFFEGGIPVSYSALWWWIIFAYSFVLRREEIAFLRNKRAESKCGYVATTPEPSFTNRITNESHTFS